MAKLRREIKKLKSGKKVTYLSIVGNQKIDGKYKRVRLESLGVLGKDITLSEANMILAENYSDVHKSIIRKKITLRELYDSFFPIYKESLTQEMFYKASLVHKAGSLKELEQMIRNKKYKLSTYESYILSMKKVNDFLGDVVVNEMDIDDTRGFLSHLVREFNFSANTVRIHFVELRKTLKYAILKGWLKNLPPIPNLNELNKFNSTDNNLVKEADAYTDEELAKMHSLANGDQRFLMELFMQTGMRPEEIDKISVKDSLVTVDLDKDIIIINSYRSNKKGRIIPLSSKLKVSIVERLNSGRITNRICPYPTTRLARRALQRVTKRAGIKTKDRKSNLKMFRATVTTNMMKNNIEGSMRASFLGNSTEVQVKHYTGNLMDNLRKIVNGVGVLD